MAVSWRAFKPGAVAFITKRMGPLCLFSLMAVQSTAAMAADTADTSSFSELTSASLNNFFEMARVFGGDLCSKVTSAMSSVISPQRTLKYLVGIIILTFLINFMMAAYNAMVKGSIHGMVGDLAVFLSQTAPKLLTHVLLAMLVATAAGITLKPASGESDWWFFKLSRTAGGSKMAALLDSYNPTSKMEASAVKISTNINGIDYMRMQTEVMHQLNALGIQAQNSTDTNAHLGTTASGSADMLNAIAKIWNATVQQMLNLVSHVAFFWGQFMLAKGFIINMIYFKIAWRMAIYFMPYMVLLAYFPSMRSYLTGIIKHLFSMSIAGYVMASVADVVFTADFWKSTLETAFSGVSLTTDEKIAFKYLPELMKTYGIWVTNVQLGFLLGFIGMLLDRIYTAVHAAVGGGVAAWGSKDLKADASILQSTRYKSSPGN